jgi:hypothetical protein
MFEVGQQTLHSVNGLLHAPFSALTILSDVPLTLPF